MRDTLLQYVFKINVHTPSASPDTSYIRNILAVVKPLSEDTPAQITRCISEAEISALTNNQEAAQMIKGGKSYVYVLPTQTLDIADILDKADYRFFTIFAGSEFDDEDWAGKNFGSFDGVLARAFSDREQAKEFSAVKNQCGFFANKDNGGKNAAFAFGALLGGAKWSNCQYIDMPLSDGVKDIGTAESLFEDRVSFVLTSPEYANCLAFFAAGKQAITAPYITEEIRTRQQGKALNWIRTNNPDYTLVNAKLLEKCLQKELDDNYVNTKLVESAKISVVLSGDNFLATGNIAIAEPKALWRLQGNLSQEAN